MTVGIIGLGLIGGSLAKAYQREEGITVLGWDKDTSITEFAQIAQAIQGPLTDDRLGELDLLLLAQRTGDGIHHGGDSGLSVLLGKLRLLGDSGNEFSLIHSRFSSCACETAPGRMS